MDDDAAGVAPPGTVTAFDFEDITIVPRVVSRVRHRADADPGMAFGHGRLRIPLIGSPMPDVCGREMCRALALDGALGVLHRFQTIDEQAADLRSLASEVGDQRSCLAAAIGVGGDHRERFAAVYEAGCRIFCLDTANGAHAQIEPAMRWVREQAPDVFLIAGNVASSEGFSWLEQQGADAIRVGIAGGAVCETRTETGVYVPTPYAVFEAFRVRRRALIIGDSGVSKPADMCKLLALGADAVMAGSALAGTREAPGRVIVVDGKKYKIMRGAASFSVQQQAGRADPEYIEGAETMVEYKGAVSDVIQRYLAGLRSSMSYLDARTLEDYRRNARYALLRHPR